VLLLLQLLLLISDIPTNSVVGFGVHKSCIALFSKQARCRPRIIFFMNFWIVLKQSSTKASGQEFCLIWDSWRRHHPKEFLRLGIRQRVVASLGMICSQVSVIVLTQAKQP
jgi:hypothetical protein